MSSDNRQAWITALETQLQKETRSPIQIPYNQVLMTFRGALLDNSLDKYGIDTVALQKWAKERGWSVRFPPSTEIPKELKETPPVIFTKLPTT
jgi:hypothetical protein